MRKHRLCRDAVEAVVTGHLPTCLRETFYLSHLTQTHQYLLFFNPSIEKINSKATSHGKEARKLFARVCLPLGILFPLRIMKNKTTVFSRVGVPWCPLSSVGGTVLQKGNVSSRPQQNEKQGQKDFVLALGLRISCRHLCLFKFWLTLTPLFPPSDLLTELLPPRLIPQNPLALPVVPVLPALVCWCSPCKTHCCTAWPLLSCRNHWLHCSEITTPEWPHVCLISVILPTSSCLLHSVLSSSFPKAPLQAFLSTCKKTEIWGWIWGFPEHCDVTPGSSTKYSHNLFLHHPLPVLCGCSS